ncbi:MAG TPA: hypothetical protein VLT33_35690 [Labilithrix sp.]|nr:hypothetical protein [Labilithrix sp.]
MKTTLGLSLLLLALAACGGSDDQGAPPGPAPTATTTPPPAAVKRTMGTARAMGTRPENLVLDPTFGSLGTQYSQAVILQDANGYLETPATSPAGPAQPVLAASPDGAQPLVAIAVQAGTGPLDVRLWIATDAKISPTVSLITPDGKTAFDIGRSASETQKHGSRTYHLYTAHITEELLGRVYLLVEPTAGEVFVAPPEVTSPAAPATMSALRPTPRGTLTAGGARAVRLLASLPLYRGTLARPGPPRP